MRDDAGVSRTPARRFVGRDSELARLEVLLAGAETGQPGVALLSGDAGVGKTRLLEELGSRAVAAGHTVLVGSCVQVGDFGLPYVPIIDALRAVEARPEGAVLLREAAARRPALGRLLPQLVEGEQASGSLGDGLAQVQLFEAVHDIVLALAELTPVLFVVEDVHWADRSTRDLLAFLVRTMRVGRVTLLISYRSDDVHRRHPLRPLLAELARRPDIERIDLSPFTRAELAELLAGNGVIDAQLLEA
jgi:predicted ATPase